MAPPLPSSDADLVRLAHGGRDDAFAALYERYFPRVYDFLARLLGNRQEAADVAQDTFIGALEQLGDLREPERFKSWLFTIAHRRGLNKIRGRRLIAVGSTVDDAGPLARIVDEARFGDPAEAASAAETANTVWEAARGLDERTYVVLDLHVRHGLESAEIADVLGVTKGNAYTMVSRMKRSVADSIGTYLLARKGTADCPDLAAIVAGSALPPMTPSLRRTVERHARECEVCQDTRDKLIAPLEVYGSLVLIPPPDGTQAAIWATIAAAGGAAAAARQDKAGGAAVIGAGAAAGAGSAGSAAAGGGGLGGAGARIAAAAAALVVVGGIAWGGFALAGGSEDPPVEVLSGQLSSGGQGPGGGSDGAGSDPAAGDPTTTLPSDSSTSTTLPPESATSTTVPSASTTTPPPSDSTTTTTVPSTTSTTVPSTTTTTVPSTTTTVPQNAPPTAVGPGTISIGEDQTVAFDPMADARDPDGDMVTLARFDATSAQGGS
ncbi:MAG: sigma-70 family RNA polymerase sigma factor, partial [Acidimicrobiia bacterium]|nr:sigma-70 family RNA polymerase sigma factor [Acidimicrobiia bacterium]